MTSWTGVQAFKYDLAPSSSEMLAALSSKRPARTAHLKHHLLTRRGQSSGEQGQAGDLNVIIPKEWRPASHTSYHYAAGTRVIPTLSPKGFERASCPIPPRPHHHPSNYPFVVATNRHTSRRRALSHTGTCATHSTNGWIRLAQRSGPSAQHISSHPA